MLASLGISTLRHPLVATDGEFNNRHSRESVQMSATFLTPETIEIGMQIVRWAREYLATEHPLMHRPVGSKVVCPFVGPALDNNSFFLSFHPEVSGRDEGHIEDIVLDHIPEFKRLGPFGAGDRNRKALLLVFPSLPENGTRVLDIVHENIKTKFVQNGLMVGQFHKDCREFSIYNQGFLVSQSPVPLIAIRHMAIHDILFVGDNRDWFNEYNIRFGEKFNRPEDIEDYNRHLIDLYFRAKARWQR